MFTLKLPNMLVVNLFGGEPFLRSDLYEIISLFAKNCKTKYISIPTNAFLTEKTLSDMSKSLTDFPDVFFKIYISLDGPSTEHSKLRKVKNGYEKLMNTVQGLIKLRNEHANISISCNINFNARTQGYMDSFLSDVISWQYFDSISLDLVRGELYDPTYLDADQKKFDELQARVSSYKLKSNQPFSPLHKAIEQKTHETIKKALENPDKRVFNCFAGKKIILLTDEGDVLACEQMLDKRMGNIRSFDYDLEKLLMSPAAQKIRKDIEQKKCNCRWECAINTSNIFDIKNYPDLVMKTFVNIIESVTTKV
jgi:radical SAM protein with 4Fe4S-binding SPASM domain